jgi:general secretion pathway protein A
MYTSYFGLNENPFSIAPDPLYLYMSEHHREALAHLQYGIQSDGGFVLLTGEVGAGKTTLCRSLLEKLPAEVVVAFVLNPKVSAIELLETICDELHIERPEQVSIKALVDRLNAYLLNANSKGQKTVLIIDEAQNLSIDVLEQLRLLTNLETNRYKLLQIVLLGQPELLHILNRQEMRQLSQRVTARCHLGPLDVHEVDAYLQHRLEIAGCNRRLFPEVLSSVLWKLTGGIPRLINLICDRALLGAYVLEKKEVDVRILRQAAREVLGDFQPVKKTNGNKLVAGLVGLMTVLLVAGVWTWQGSLSAAPRLLEVNPVPQGQTTKPVEQAPLSSKEARAVGDASLSQTWPEGFAENQSMEAAFADLSALWGLSAPAGGLDVCTFALENNLACLARKDGVETLRKMNRPAILTLYGDNGEPFHVVIAGLGKDAALFVAGESKYELSLSVLESRWFGEYLLLWQRPDLGAKLLQPGSKGVGVDWLANILEELGMYTVTGKEERLEGRLLGAFKSFQFNNGLTPDGVLGPMTLIRLNSARNLGGPSLDLRGTS